MVDFLFCNDVLDKNSIDEAYYEEFKIANSLNLECHLFNFEKLVDEKDPSRSIKGIKRDNKLKSNSVIYRGWMLDPLDYYKLYGALALQNNMFLINSPEQYKNCHWFPNSYDVIKDITPFSTWVLKEEFNIDNLPKILEPFKNKPIVIKDYVKSEKHFWNEACFCPDASDIDKVKNTIKNLTSIRDIEGGYVFKEFVDLDEFKFNPVLKTNTAKEYRLFFLNNILIETVKYWDENYSESPPIDMFKKVGEKIKSNFFTMDIAKKKNGEWIIIEVGDGQVSGLPTNCDIQRFYERICYEFNGA